MSNRAISTELIELGERIRKRRQEMKLSQESFAEKAGISVNTVSRIEGGQTAMSVEIFRKMIEILETDANTWHWYLVKVWMMKNMWTSK